MGTNTFYRIIIAAGLLVAALGLVISQEPFNVSFEQIKTENVVRVQGLSQNMVNTIIQDRRGYLWYGTWDGLNQFDGYNFRIYNKQSGMSNSTVNALLEVDDRKIWIGTQDGLNILDVRTRSITIMKNIPGESNSLSNNTINDLFMDAEGNIWISTVQGLNRYDSENHVFTRYNFTIHGADSIRTNWINKVVQDRSGYLWIATRYGLFKFDDSTRLFNPYFHSPGDPSSISSNDINELFIDSRGNIWVGTRNGLNLYLPGTDDFKCFNAEHNDPLSLSNNNVNAIFEDHRGTLWIGTTNKLNILDRKSMTFSHFTHTGKSTDISNDNINCIFEDDMGTVWVGTYKGVNKVNIGLGKFNYYHRDPENPHSISSDIIHTIYKDSDGKVWIGTARGVNILDEESGNFSQLHYMLDPFTDLSEEGVRSLSKDHNGNFWFATNSHGLLCFEPANGRFRLYTAGEAGNSKLNSNATLWVIEDHLGCIWIGSDRGVNTFYPDSGIMRSYMHNPRNPASISSNQVWIIYRDSQDRLWFGTDNGLNLYQRKTDDFISYTFDPDDPFSISANPVYGVFEDSKGIFWVGTMGGGLNRFDPATGRFKAYTTADGLPNNVVYIALEDHNGYLWMSTNWGISKFDPESGEFTNYDINDGLQGNEFNGGAWFHADDGKMYFGGMDGFNSFIPEEISLNSKPPRIVITEFNKFNTHLQRGFSDGDTIKLNYDDNFFSIEFSALDYTNPAKNKYRYILENYDKEWTSRDAVRRIADYTRVAPGSYTFRVTGSNNDGVWNQEGISLYIVIRPAWYDTLLFRILFGTFLFALLWSVIYWRIRMIKRKHEVEKRVLAIEKELFDVQQKALQLQMNPHFIFNSLNAIQSFVLNNDTDKAIHYLSKFSQLMRLILSNSRESSIPIKEELKALTHYMDIERLRFDNKFDYTIMTDERIDQEFMEIPPMIIQPFVENAILHGLIHSPSEGHINISLELRGSYIFCVIEDNGVGRRRALEIREASGIKRESRGMVITRERLKILNKQNEEKFSVNVIDLTDEEGKASGTRVELNIQFIEE